MFISGVDLWDEGVDFVEFLQSKHILLHRGEGFLVSLYLLTMFWIGFCLGNFPVAKGRVGTSLFCLEKNDDFPYTIESMVAQ